MSDYWAKAMKIGPWLHTFTMNHTYKYETKMRAFITLAQYSHGFVLKIKINCNLVFFSFKFFIGIKSSFFLLESHLN